MPIRIAVSRSDSNLLRKASVRTTEAMTTHSSVAARVLLLIAALLILAQSTLVDAAATKRPHWWSKPTQQGGCRLPSAFAPNVVGGGGQFGCIPGAYMKRGASCTVTCKHNAVPAATSSNRFSASYMYVVGIF
jgi:hypothetical protein